VQATLASTPPCGPSPDLSAEIKDSKLLRTQNYVGGQWIEAADGRQLEVRAQLPPAAVHTAAHCL
jgi:hypothetical protein